ncbi:hypothetical protein EIP91_010733 [Steccherinum ochraceum]|uniref:Uncharacterized protein n=1 Tax=Steccherinum ochraceum TaxID=92696 RepID=A0A4V2MX16_9APHY|nr:hypothetical protein EIP91_010733 [Steccherinum ochraceum]
MSSDPIGDPEVGQFLSRVLAPTILFTALIWGLLARLAPFLGGFVSLLLFVHVWIPLFNRLAFLSIQYAIRNDMTRRTEQSGVVRPHLPGIAEQDCTIPLNSLEYHRLLHLRNLERWEAQTQRHGWNVKWEHQEIPEFDTRPMTYPPIQQGFKVLFEKELKK